MSREVHELGRFEEVRDGVPLKFKICTVPEHLVEPVVRHMAEIYLPREPMSAHYRLHEDPKTVAILKELWTNMVKDGASMVAVREGPEDEADRIIGANMTYISTKNPPKPQIICGSKLEPMYDAVMDIAEKARIFEKYGVDRYMSAFGLSVHHDYHGYKVGERLLQSRKPLAKILGIKVTGTVYTHVKSQHLSKKVGFEVLYKEEYSKYKYNGVVTFEGLPGIFEQSAWYF